MKKSEVKQAKSVDGLTEETKRKRVKVGETPRVGVLKVEVRNLSFKYPSRGHGKKAFVVRDPPFHEVEVGVNHCSEQASQSQPGCGKLSRHRGILESTRELEQRCGRIFEEKTSVHGGIS